MQLTDNSRRRLAAAALLAIPLGLLAAAAPERAHAAPSEACAGGGFSLAAASGATVSGPTETTVPAAALGERFLVRGRYVEFTVHAATLAVSDYTLTGAPNPHDITGGRRTGVFAAKTPNLRGLSLTGDLGVELGDDDLVIQRSGPGVSMKIQAKDCAQGGIFQMEPERADDARTVISHTLADGVFYFDNPFFRARIGQMLNGVEVSARVNFANDASRRFVGRDSAQVADRLTQTGRTTTWNVASGGRMGGVLGEDAVEVAPPSTNCVRDCQAQNQVRGRFAVLGFPFPVPAASRLTAAGAPAGGATGPSAVAVRSVSIAPRISTRTLRSRGLRLALRLRADARVIRVAVFRTRGARTRGRALAVEHRTVPRGAQALRMRLTGRRLVRSLRPGRYEVRARAGGKRAELGAPVGARFTVTR